MSNLNTTEIKQTNTPNYRRTPQEARHLNEQISLPEIMLKFKEHRAKGLSAPSFQGSMGVSQWTIQKWIKQFPTFAKAYQDAVGSNKRLSLHGNLMGPKSKTYLHQNDSLYEVHVPVQKVLVYHVKAHNKQEAWTNALNGKGQQVGSAEGSKKKVQKLPKKKSGEN